MQSGHPCWRASLSGETDAVGRLLAVQNICSLEMFEFPNVMYCCGWLVLSFQEAAGK